MSGGRVRKAMKQNEFTLRTYSSEAAKVRNVLLWKSDIDNITPVAELTSRRRLPSSLTRRRLQFYIVNTSFTLYFLSEPTVFL